MKGSDRDVKALSRGIAEIDNPDHIRDIFRAIENKRSPIAALEAKKIKVPANLKGLQLRQEVTKQLSEAQLLRQKLTNLSRGAKIGAKARQETITKAQDDLVKLIKQNLPVSERGKFISLIKNTTSPKKLADALDTVVLKTDQYLAIKAMSKEVNTLKGRAAFIKRVGEFNQTVANEVKREVGANLPKKGQQIAKLLTIDSISPYARQELRRSAP